MVAESQPRKTHSQNIDAIQDPLPLPEFEQAVLEQVEQEKMIKLGKLQTRAAFVPAMFPVFYRYDEDEFNDRVQGLSDSSEAYRVSHPSRLKAHAYRGNTSQSMRQHRSTGRFLLLSANEFAGIINVPESYAAGAQAKCRSSVRSSHRSQSDREANAVRAGAHSLDGRIKEMANFKDMYTNDIDGLRRLVPLIKNHWHANAPSGLDVIDMAYRTRDSLQQILQNVADVDGWSSDDLELAWLGLDKRLMYGRGKEALQSKKDNWLKLAGVLGNYMLDKRRLVVDRIERSNAEVLRRYAIYPEDSAGGLDG